MTETPTTCSPPAGTLDFHLRCVERALEDAQSFLMDETPEIGTREEAGADTLDLVRSALLKHLPEVRKTRVAELDEVEVLRGLARLLWNCHFELGERLFVNRGLSEGTWPHARLTPLGKRALGVEG